MVKKTKSSRTPKQSTSKACSECIGDVYLRKVAIRFGTDDMCTYCCRMRKTITVYNLAVHIKRLFDDHFIIKSDNQDISKPEFIRNRIGNVSDIIQKYAKVTKMLANDVQRELMTIPRNRKNSFIKRNNPFGKLARYERRKINSHYWDSLWLELRKTIMKENRLFNKKAENILNSIFKNTLDTGSHKRYKVSAIVEIGPHTKTKRLFRAREFQDDETLHVALCHPDRELGPPPSSKASSGRMNAHGIAVFYGATNIDVAIAEIRPAVGSRVIIAKFSIIRKLRLLDVAKLQSIFNTDSMFRPSHKRILEKREFISSLCERMSAPVMPQDQSTDYLVTQAISDYLSELRDLNSIDGLIYRSAQKGSEAKNVVLFYKASRVKFRMEPTKVRVFKDFEYIPDSDSEVVYYVYESISSRHEREGVKDEREPSLRLRSSSIFVRHIESVDFNTRPQVVRRHKEK